MERERIRLLDPELLHQQLLGLAVGDVYEVRREPLILRYELRFDDDQILIVLAGQHGRVFQHRAEHTDRHTGRGGKYGDPEQAGDGVQVR